MRRAYVYLHGRAAGMLTEENHGGPFRYAYLGGYEGPPLSVTLPVDGGPWRWETFPAFFLGLLPEGVNCESALRAHGLEEDDLWELLLAIGEDTSGAAQVFPAGEESPEANSGTQHPSEPEPEDAA